ncbi:MAG TPA: bifunctional adenosylcobinamide kinase/adenosylcobinamide-phosphate guanylyltransferase [Candidatus Pelethocola excrementipullorum]|nr:bifunctional adenosylcobinamide kinase/adenosylcobinamide-phosphate guanylyltransferase [Candidatus Pelethocola excrementipullorum]
MILVIGGAFQGKSAYAKEHFDGVGSWIDGEICGFEEIFSCGGIVHFHQFVRRFLKEDELDRLPERLVRSNPQIVIVTDELGYGVVPVVAGDRAWREKTGRLCTRLASNAGEVHRVVCGIGMVIKNA